MAAYPARMKRKIPYLISTLFLCGVLSIVLRTVDSPTPRRLLCAYPPLASAASPTLRTVAPAVAEPSSSQTAPTAAAPAPMRSKATPIREVRVRAARDGRDYGWVQLPRGTRVELIRDEGATLLIRYDQVTLRIDRAVADAGMVVPLPRKAVRLAGL